MAAARVSHQGTADSSPPRAGLEVAIPGDGGGSRRLCHPRLALENAPRASHPAALLAHRAIDFHRAVCQRTAAVPLGRIDPMLPAGALERPTPLAELRFGGSGT